MLTSGDQKIAETLWTLAASGHRLAEKGHWTATLRRQGADLDSRRESTEERGSVEEPKRRRGGYGCGVLRREDTGERWSGLKG